MTLFRKLTNLISTAVFGVAALVLFAQPALAATTPVQTNPANYTPQIMTSDSMVRQLVPCGNLMYAVGDFTQVKDVTTGATLTRNRAFSFNASTGAITAWNPNVNGVVNSLGILPDCSEAYLGGKFTSVHGTAVRNIAAVNTTTGAAVSGFTSNAAGQVEALLVTKGHLLVGGYFSGISDSTRSYLASLNTTTGKDDGYSQLKIAGNYQYTDNTGSPANTNPTRIYNFSLGPGGNRLLMMGDFTSVNGVRRQQIFMADLGASQLSLDAWYSPEFNQYCYHSEPYYLQDAAWSPDSSTIYIDTTGYKPANGPGSVTTQPRAGLCDAVAAFGSNSVSNLAHQWVNYSGCDSFFSIAADANEVYVGGHQRWANNPNGCDAAGPGALARPGIGGLSPSSGAATSWNPTRDRGQGADDMVLTTAGLWVASDTYFGSAYCGHEYHPGICFLPY